MPLYHWRQPNFKTLLIGRLLVLTLASVLLVAVIGARFMGHQMETDASEHLRESAIHVRDGLESYLCMHRLAIINLGQALQPAYPGSEILRASAARALDDASKTYPGFLTMLVTDSNGRIVRAIRRQQSSFTPGPHDNQWVNDRSYFLQPQKSREPFVSGVFRGRGLGSDPIVAISAPILDATGRFAGVIEGSIDITQIPLTATYLHQTPIVIAHDANRNIVYSTRPDLHPPLQQWKGFHTQKASASAAVDEIESILVEDPAQRGPQGADRAGAEQLAVELGVNVAGWQVISMLPVAVVEQQAHRFYWTVALAFLFVSIGTWQAARIMARSIAQPIVSLVHDMQQYDLETAPQLSPGKPDAHASGAKGYVAREIEQIHTEFVGMGNRLRDSFRLVREALRERDRTNAELQEVLRNLDRSVTERTAQLAESEARYRHVIENSGDIIYRTDPTGRITFHNAAFEKVFGRKLIGVNVLRLMGRECRKQVSRSALDQIDRRVPSIYVEFSIPPAPNTEGPTVWIGQSTQLLMNEAGRILGFQAIARDITEQRAAELALRVAQERYTLAVRGSRNGVWDWDLVTGQVFFSDRWTEMFGLVSADVAGCPDDWWKLVHPNDLPRLQSGFSQYIGNGPELFEIEHRIRHSDGTYRWVLTCAAAVRGKDGVALRIAGSTTDVTSGKLVDPLTGLANRLSIVERLEQLVVRQREDHSRGFAVLFMDLDRFKLINDSLGHLKGDQLLIGVTSRLLVALESLADMSGGFAGRLGGDEFVVVIEDARRNSLAVRVAEAIQNEMEAPFELDGGLIFVSTSIGISYSDAGPHQGSYSAEDTLRNADTAMYHAKGEGRGRYSIFDSSMHARAVARLELESDLRQAIEQNEFVMFYQPQISLRTGVISGFEALVRWNHPKRGLVSPVEFISAAEENGLILPLGRWVLAESCRQLAHWDREHECCRTLTMSVNLSSRQFADPALYSLVSETLAQTGLDPARLNLEVTESMVADDPKAASEVLTALSELGVGLEVDDFGTGYSCLSQLHQLPFDTLKVDRSFVRAMDREHAPHADGRKIVESIITLSSNLGINVVAEGIETASNWTQLAALGCKFGQGYYFSRPVSADEALRLTLFRTREPWPLPHYADATSDLAGLGRNLEAAHDTEPVHST